MIALFLVIYINYCKKLILYLTNDFLSDRIIFVYLIYIVLFFRRNINMKKLLSKTLIFANIVSAGMCSFTNSLAMDVVTNDVENNIGDKTYMGKRKRSDSESLWSKLDIDSQNNLDSSDCPWFEFNEERIDPNELSIYGNSPNGNNPNNPPVNKIGGKNPRDKWINTLAKKINNLNLHEEYGRYGKLRESFEKYVKFKLSKINSEMDATQQFETLVNSIDTDIKNGLANLHGQKITIDKLEKNNIDNPILLVSKLFKNYSILNTTYGSVIKICGPKQKNSALGANSYMYFIPRASLVMLAFEAFIARLQKNFNSLSISDYQYLDSLANNLGFESWKDMSKGYFSKDKNKQFPLFYSKTDLKNIL